MRSLPPSSGRAPASASISVVLPVPLGPTSETCSPRSSHSSPSSTSSLWRSPSPTSRRPSSSSKITRPVRSGLANGKPELARVARVAVDPLDLVEGLDARLRLLGLRRLRAEALDERLHPRDLGLLLLDRLAERQLARRLLAAPRVPRALEVPRAAGLQLQHARCRRPPGTSGRARPGRSRSPAPVSVCSSHSSDSMSRWLVGSSSSSRSASTASARASEARVSWPPENVSSLRSSASSAKPRPCR